MRSGISWAPVLANFVGGVTVCGRTLKMTESTDAKTPFEQLGGSAAVERLVNIFYEEMDQQPQAKTIRAMHAKDLKSSKEKLRLFLTGWLGGPPLYVEKYGHPRLRRRHFPFAVDTAAAEAWMACMDVALEKVVSDRLLRDQLRGAFQNVAAHMRNTDDADA